MRKAERMGPMGKGLTWLWLSALVVVLDQVTKYLAVSGLQPSQPVAVLPSFNLLLAYNRGAAFSILNDAGGWQRWFFVALALIVGGFIVVWLRSVDGGRWWTAAALSLVLGGALGNLCDRLSLGYVIDFVQVYYGEWAWPTFNVADSAITVGALMLVLDAFRTQKPA